MLDTAIIGGGLCGLALAQSLQSRKVNFALYEARPRFGGRILSVSNGLHTGMLDLGATWYWPEQQPNITRLLTALGLESIAQHDNGTALQLHDPAEAAKPIAMAELHNGARRIKGGAGAVIQALLARLPAAKLQSGWVLEQVIERTDHIEARLRRHDQCQIVQAGRLVLAIPPRVLLETVRFEPPLPPAVVAALQGTPTWMATAAKAAMAYPRASWREQGQSGNAFVTHDQATLAEVYDACGPEAAEPALAGFLALEPDQRRRFEAGLPMLIRSQFMQLYGPECEQGELHCFDWAAERFTCSPLDRAEGNREAHPQYGDPVLRQGLWNNRLLLGSAETADQAGGYMEGALVAAARLVQQLSSAAAGAAAASLALGTENLAAIAQFGDWVMQQRLGAATRYQQRLQQAFSRQASQEVTGQALSATVHAIYKEALTELDKLPFDSQGLPVERGRCALTPAVLRAFSGFNETLLSEAVRLNQTSCAMSNFPAEHQPSPEYVQAIRSTLNGAWHAFAYAVNDHLLAAQGKTPQALPGRAQSG